MKYNPAFLEDDELVSSFAVRQADLEWLLRIIRENTGPSNQHILLLGPRGVGKTTLILRAAIETRRAPDLRERWYPIIFGEESYHVTSPGRLWLEALLHLGRLTGDPRWSRAYQELQKERHEPTLRARALGQLLDFADREGKRLLLGIENLHMVLGDEFSDQDAWDLREVLLNEPRLMFLGSATSRFKEIDEYDHALYEVFRPRELQPLNTQECADLWLAITGQTFDLHQIRPIEILTGGNPRLMIILGSFEREFSLRNLLGELENLVDNHTDYFKGQLDRLAATERRVYLSLAEIWDPATANEVATHAGLAVNVTSALLKRLVERGAVLAEPLGKKKFRYQVAERLYNIYYLMRRHGESTTRVRVVVKFMVGLYAKDILLQKTRLLAETACGLEPQDRRLHYQVYQDIINTLELTSREKLLRETPSAFFEGADIPPELKRLFGASTFADGEEREATAENPLDLNLELLTADDRRWVELLEQADALRVQRADDLAIEQLLVRATEAVPEIADSWACFGIPLAERFSRYDLAASAFRRSVSIDPADADVWVMLGCSFTLIESFPEAEFAFRRAVEIEPVDSFSWWLIGQVLEEQNRDEEAITAYRTATTSQPPLARAWINLGRLLRIANQGLESESSIREGIRLEPDNIQAWTELCAVLAHLDRFAEAESAGSQLLKLDPSHAAAWLIYIFSLLGQPDRLQDAERCLEELIQTKSDHYGLLCEVAEGLYIEGIYELLDRAEQLAKRAVKISPEPGPAHRVFAAILSKQGKPLEALPHAQTYLQNVEEVSAHSGKTTALFVELAAAGQAPEALRILLASPSKDALEPLIVGLRLFLGEEVNTALEILEIGKDIVKQIHAVQHSA